LKIGITGSSVYEDKRKIKEFIFKLKNHDNIEIVTRGNKDGADKYIKKYALEFGVTYIEVPVAHTSRSLYSQLPDLYFNKPFSIRNYFIQQSIYIKQCEKFVIFGAVGDNVINNLLHAINKVEKNTIIIT
jgi:secreted Zn-dependent insulinase-like peptidase